MRNICITASFLFVLQLPFCALGQKAASKPAAAASEPITLEFGNMKSEKPTLLKQADYLKSVSGDSGSVSYATQYIEMMQIAKRVGAQNLSQSETDLLVSVAEPTEGAMTAYLTQKEQARQRVTERTEAVDTAVAKWRAAKLEEAKLAEEKRQADEKARIEQDKVNAMHRQAAAQEKMARAQAAQAQLLNRINGYYYY